MLIFSKRKHIADFLKKEKKGGGCDSAMLQVILE